MNSNDTNHNVLFSTDFEDDNFYNEPASNDKGVINEFLLPSTHKADLQMTRPRQMM